VSLLSKPILFLIRAYQATKCIRPATCRFYPTCSEYSAQAISQHGTGRGLLLTVIRLLKCHPFHPGGVDEVPTLLHDPAKAGREGTIYLSAALSAQAPNGIEEAA